MAAASPPIGIDLGTTFSVVAYLDSTGRPCTIPNTEGDLLTPSVVLFDDQKIVVGKEAAKAAPLVPGCIADFAKRDMGNSRYTRQIGGEWIPPEVIQSLILEKLKRDSEMRLGPIRQAVVTVPAFFNEPRRKATQDAGSLAGFEQIEIINEPTAAAIAYGYQTGFLDRSGNSQRAERVLVYDLGGGTFDVTIMEIDQGNFTAIATGGDVCLGGSDWDRRIADTIADQFVASYPSLDPRSEPSGMQRLLREAEDAKRTLSARDQASISLEYRGNGIRLAITRPQFAELTADLLDRTRFTVRNVLKDAGQSWGDITRLLLVGGSTRMPMVAEMLEHESGLPVDRQLAADEAVAHGAAIYAGFVAARQAGQSTVVRVRNVNSHNLGVLGKEPATGRPHNTVVIPRNSILPASNHKRFQTAKDNQRSVLIPVIEGGDRAGNNSTAIGTCVIKPLPEGLPAGTAIDVRFTYEENGRLTVEGKLPGLAQPAMLNIERSSGISDAKLKEWDQRLRAENPVESLSLDDGNGGAL
ncbi:MAG: Hsp70 family protein [Pirellulales bacterium]